MSEFTDEYDSSKVVCPYCQNAYEPECENFNEGERIAECTECGNRYHYVYNIKYIHLTIPDCEINGLTHKWEPHKLRDGTYHDFCKVCGECRPIERPVK